MKNAYRIFAGLVLSTTLLTQVGCNSSGGSGSAAPTTGVVGASNQQGFVGNATWFGSLTVANMTSYQAFLARNGLCIGYQCTAASPWLQIQISTAPSGGSLPGPVNFALSPSIGGASSAQLSGQAQGFMNAANNGILLNYNGYSQFFNNYNNYYNPNVNNAVPMLQINTQYTNVGMAVQVIYMGTPIAGGNVTGTLQQQQQQQSYYYPSYSWY